MSEQYDLVDGVARMLTEARVGHYDPTGAGYDTTTLPPITLGPMPEQPDRCISVTVYLPGGPWQLGVQVRVRGVPVEDDSLDAAEQAAAIRAVLHGRHDLMFGATIVRDLTLASAGSIGLDGARRDEWSLNFYATTADPAVGLTFD